MQKRFSMTKLIWIVLFAAVLIYIISSALSAGRRDAATVNAVSYTVENACTVSGILVRDETLLTSSAPFVDVRPADGEKVGVGQTLAVTCDSEEQLELLRRMNELEMSIARLGDIVGQEVAPSEAVKMDSEILDGTTAISALRAGGDLFGASSRIAEIKSLVVARTELSSAHSDAQSALSAMQNELGGIMQKIKGSSKITSAVSGTFSSRADGYESAITPDSLGSVTVAGIDSLMKNEPAVSDGAFGKFVNGVKWYYAAVVNYSDVEGVYKGSRLKMRFLNGCGGDLTMTVERIDEPDGEGRSVLVMSCTDALSETIGLRRQPAEIINSSVEGIRVPKNAMRVSEDGQSGVYTVNGNTATFRMADVIWDLEDYVLVEENTSDTLHLRRGEKIIVGEKELFEGKVVIYE